jgi:limonene-1,2-epoxide hydrolase
MTNAASDLVTRFVREFDAPAPDAAALGDYFTDDAVYHNIPMDPVKGRETIMKVLGGMGTSMKSAGWDVIHQVADGNVVMNERVDRFKVGEKDVAVRVVGVFEVRGDKIAAWRDYFDLAEFQKQMA